MRLSVTCGRRLRYCTFGHLGLFHYTWWAYQISFFPKWKQQCYSAVNMYIRNEMTDPHHWHKSYCKSDTMNIKSANFQAHKNPIVELCKCCETPTVRTCVVWIDQPHQFHNPPVPYRTRQHAHFCSEWCIEGYETGVLWDWWIAPIYDCVVQITALKSFATL